MRTGPYRIQLDGLRAVAVMCVVLQHFSPAAWSRWIPWGGIGVTLFFILSSYLITGILLRGRDEAEATGFRLFYFLRGFYIRRALRIFPLYYATLTVAAILAIPPVRQTFWWHASYLSNVYFAWKNSYCGAVSPFWSLSVEQHFYIFWPWVVLFVPRRRLGITFTAVIGLGVAFHLIGHASGWNAVAVNVLTPAAFEPFGLGALLAWLERIPGVCKQSVTPFLLMGLLFLPFALWLSWIKPGSGALGVVNSFAWWPLFFWLVAGAAQGFPGLGGRALASPPAVYIGKISYGIYLLHNFVFSWVPLRWDTTYPGLRGMIALGLTLCIASISYEFLETPLRQLKRFFPYSFQRHQRNEITNGPLQDSEIQPLIYRRFI